MTLSSANSTTRAFQLTSSKRRRKDLFPSHYHKNFERNLRNSGMSKMSFLKNGLQFKAVKTSSDISIKELFISLITPIAQFNFI